jgi:hypothetical protein
VAIGDVNGDGKPDLVTANHSANTVSVLLGNGNGTFGPKTDFATGSLPSSVAIDDLNGDGKPDLVTANHNASTASVLLGNGDGTFGPKTDFMTGSGPFSLAIGDLNGDGKPDVAVATNGSSTVSVLLGNGEGTFGSKTDFATGNVPYSVAIGDLNGDGKPDLAAANNSSSTVSVLLGNGDGTFGPKTDFVIGSLPFSVAIADLNGDGKPDLAVANQGGSSNYTGRVSVLLGDGDGTFGANGAKIGYATGNRPYSVAIGDLNGDSRPDLIAANFGSNTVSVLLNTGGQPWVGVATQAATAGELRMFAWPNPLVAGARFAFVLPSRREVSLSVYDITGRLVSTVVRGTMAAGAHEARWDLSSPGGPKVNAGIYLVELRAGAERTTTRLAVLR